MCPALPAISSMQATASSSALCASIGPEVTSPITHTPGVGVLKWSLAITPRLSGVTPTVSRPRPSVYGRRPMAALAAHGLGGLDPAALAAVRSAIDMQGWHALALLACGL